eukprot:TRINITY_DN52002_c0_g1_i2.p1 TRINITY_DN52002_c0_g1~~TRINITY_DN52002_c0_g1_i2.p1  ORF type:complete len:560 (+),score=37.29 TRINITY_DN52002_c0_g1_i2:30-1709(+)
MRAAKYLKTDCALCNAKGAQEVYCDVCDVQICSECYAEIEVRGCADCDMKLCDKHCVSHKKVNPSHRTGGYNQLLEDNKAAHILQLNTMMSRLSDPLVELTKSRMSVTKKIQKARTTVLQATDFGFAANKYELDLGKVGPAKFTITKMTNQLPPKATTTQAQPAPTPKRILYCIAGSTASDPERWTFMQNCATLVKVMNGATTYFYGKKVAVPEGAVPLPTQPLGSAKQGWQDLPKILQGLGPGDTLVLVLSNHGGKPGTFCVAPSLSVTGEELGDLLFKNDRGASVNVVISCCHATNMAYDVSRVAGQAVRCVAFSVKPTSSRIGLSPIISDFLLRIATGRAVSRAVAYFGAPGAIDDFFRHFSNADVASATLDKIERAVQQLRKKDQKQDEDDGSDFMEISTSLWRALHKMGVNCPWQFLAVPSFHEDVDDVATVRHHLYTHQYQATGKYDEHFVAQHLTRRWKMTSTLSLAQFLLTHLPLNKKPLVPFCIDDYNTAEFNVFHASCEEVKQHNKQQYQQYTEEVDNWLQTSCQPAEEDAVLSLPTLHKVTKLPPLVL